MKLVCLILLSLAASSYGQCDSGNFPNGAACIVGICSGCLNGICCSPDGDATATSAGTTLFSTGFTVSSLFTTFAPIIASPGCIGPCFDNACPTSYTCNTATQECCSGQTTSSGQCRDLIGPKGYSDCPRLASLCNNATYMTIMTQQCPKTCGRCNNFTSSGIPSSTNCVDRTNPRTGVSECPQLAYLCTNPAYTTIMTQQCPRTCGRCGTSSLSGLTSSSINGLSSSSINGLSSSSINSLSSSSSSNCVDKTNARSGISDCTAVAYLCNNPAYRTIMTQQCPRTCGRCNSTITG